MRFLLNGILIFMLTFLSQMAMAFNDPQNNIIEVVIETDKGNIELELFPYKAPITVENFLQNIKAGIYEGGRFYRASRPDNNKNAKRKILTLIQGGKNEQKQARSAISHETTFQSGLSHLDGVISMARLEPGTAASEFFISIGDNSELDYGTGRYEEGQRQGYAAFGRVTSGMDVVTTIQQQPTGNKAKDDADWFGQQLINDTIIIKRIVIK
ncbi:MAG: peptidylprolyl isomerase [Emcibacter sp.]|nr:peptidylprolyl isomerase [Emcibacter sp.]